MQSWNPTSWQTKPAAQQPAWPDQAALEEVLTEIGQRPPLARMGEILQLREELSQVAAGRAFILQAGDCAESFDDFSFDNVRNKLKIILQMAIILLYSGGMPVVRIGRIAGQFAKPRSAPTELVDGVELPSFRGHIVNDDHATEAARAPDPQRLLRAYDQSMETIDILRGLTKGGFADLRQVHRWNAEFVSSSPEGQRYEQLAAEIDRALDFMESCGIDLAHDQTLHEVSFFTSHEALLLGYEEALARPYNDQYVETSAHTVWIGERTRQLDGAHIEFVSGILNPIGVKIGPTATPEEVATLAKTLNPHQEPGKLMFIARMGTRKVREALPPLVEEIKASGIPVIWICDPMHGNTKFAEGDRKTRSFNDIFDEIDGFFSVLRAAGVHPGGVHLELTGDDVTECLGGSDQLREDQLHENYTTACDPRLNARQSLDLAFHIAELLRQ